ncbi:MAG TPA: DNA-binding protein Alba [Methanomassiliicoccales archaeon]|jgi:DNA-binding protein|nr:DNA-binding protein Alba [Methanomassiliicoccales archaeon]HPR98195.1 DNA-binding protein Alba [Methanomassiliicoccales archaeon]
MFEGNVMFIGNKPIMSYVLTAVPKLQELGELTIKARGMSISKAVDVALILQDRYIKECHVDGIDIRTEVLDGDNGEKVNVSSIQVHLRSPVP